MIVKKELEKIDKDVLFKVCIMYDIVQGEFPETPYEGQSIYEFYLMLTGAHLGELGYTTRKDRACIYEEIIEKYKKVHKDTQTLDFEDYLQQELSRRKQNENRR